MKDITAGRMLYPSTNIAVRTVIESFKILHYKMKQEYKIQGSTKGGITRANPSI